MPLPPTYSVSWRKRIGEVNLWTYFSSIAKWVTSTEYWASKCSRICRPADLWQTLCKGQYIQLILVHILSTYSTVSPFFSIELWLSLGHLVHPVTTGGSARLKPILLTTLQNFFLGSALYRYSLCNNKTEEIQRQAHDYSRTHHTILTLNFDIPMKKAPSTSEPLKLMKMAMKS